ncbi:SIT4 phosphatase-associated protein [Plasmodiophora brassicae]|uniref:Uncharacterized protein n=1 Tax=Plasmodiophora brassicae TaxID=37360 RepID=A0A0G4IL35_PLABS|nr:hypothetical protein PBRA_004515 [Plasmodiophora brassicae]SPR00072.1 unnamed protein product [Plasmodiophora brassicae]
MGDLQGSFWTSGLADAVVTSASSLAAMLDDPEACTLAAVLADNDVIQECKSLNKALNDFLCRPDVILEMITMIVSGSSNVESVEERNALVASEIVACEVGAITDAIMSSEAALDKLFSFVLTDHVGTNEAPPHLDARRAGHVRKVLSVLIQKRYDDLAKYIEEHAQIVPALVRRVANTSILEVIIMLGWDDGNPENINDRKWLFNLKLVPELVSMLRPDQHELVHVNAAHALVDMILKCPPSTTSYLVGQLQSPPVLSALLANCVSGPISAYDNGLAVLSVLVQRHAIMSHEFEDPAFGDEVPFPVQLICDNLSTLFHYIIEVAPVAEPVPSVMGGIVEVLGNARLKSAELVLALLRTGYVAVQSQLAATNFVPVIVSYFFKYQWNSMLHFITETVAVSLFTSASSSALKHQFLQKGQFVANAMAAFEQNRLEMRKRNGVRLGHMGHIIRILNMIVSVDRDSTISPEWIHPDRESWISFVESDLAVENSKLNVQLGGGRPDVNGLDPQTGPSVLGPSRADLDADDEDEFDGVDTGNAGAKYRTDFSDDFDAIEDNSQSQTAFDAMNNQATPFDGEPWPVSFDDKMFVSEEDDIFGTAFGSEDSVVVRPDAAAAPPPDEDSPA